MPPTSVTSTLIGLCYNNGDPIYGEFTSASIKKIAEVFETKPGEKIHLVDIGSGSGRFMCELVKYMNPDVNEIKLTGYEISEHRVGISQIVIPELLRDKKDQISWNIIHSDILNVSSLPTTVTHCVSGDAAFPAEVGQHIENLQWNSPNLKYIMSNWTYPNTRWTLVDAIRVALRGSGEHRTAYIYSKRV